jgi:hypothetical protein
VDTYIPIPGLANFSIINGMHDFPVSIARLNNGSDPTAHFPLGIKGRVLRDCKVRSISAFASAELMDSCYKTSITYFSVCDRLINELISIKALHRLEEYHKRVRRVN